MPLADTTVPLRIAVVGLDRTGAYHLERLGLRDDIQVVATHHRDAARAAALPPGGAEFHPCWESLLDDPAIELVLLTGPPEARAHLAREAIEAGRHVAMPLPLAGSAAQADALLAASRRSGRVVAALPFHRWNDDFRTAALELHSGKLGRLQSAKCVLWQYRAGDDQEVAPLDAVGADLLDQMLQFIDAAPRDVTARIYLSKEDRQTGFTLAVGFGGEQTGLLDVHFAAIAPQRLGWVLQGTEGAWQNFRRYTRTDEEEIYETPVEPLPTFWDQAYTELLRVVRETEPGRIPAVTREARLVVELLDAARESAATGRTVALAPRPQW